MSTAVQNYISAAYFLLSLNGKTYIVNGSILKFSSNTLLTEDLIAIKYMRYLVHHLLT